MKYVCLNTTSRKNAEIHLSSVIFLNIGTLISNHRSRKRDEIYRLKSNLWKGHFNFWN